MAELQDLVGRPALHVDYDRHSAERQFKPGDLVWLSEANLIYDGRETGQ